jgi:hypothetical protein
VLPRGLGTVLAIAEELTEDWLVVAQSAPLAQEEKRDRDCWIAPRAATSPERCDGSPQRQRSLLCQAAVGICASLKESGGAGGVTAGGWIWGCCRSRVGRRGPSEGLRTDRLGRGEPVIGADRADFGQPMVGGEAHRGRQRAVDWPGVDRSGPD